MIELLASFTSPITVSNGPAMFIFLLPLVTVIALVYKAIKVPEPFSAYTYIRQSIVLIVTIIAFMALLAAALYAIMWIVMVRT